MLNVHLNTVTTSEFGMVVVRKDQNWQEVLRILCTFLAKPKLDCGQIVVSEQGRCAGVLVS